VTRLAIFGAGRIGGVHAVNAAAIEGVEIVHLVDPAADCDALAARLKARRSTAAEALADAAGVRLGRVTSIVEGFSGGPQPMMDVQRAQAEPAVGAPIEPGSEEIQASVTVTFAIE